LNFNGLHGHTSRKTELIPYEVSVISVHVVDEAATGSFEQSVWLGEIKKILVNPFSLSHMRSAYKGVL
jgi:hypothetical protein